MPLEVLIGLEERKNRDRSDDNTRILSRWEMGRFAVNQTSLKNHQLKLTLKTHNNNNLFSKITSMFISYKDINNTIDSATCYLFTYCGH